MDKETIEGNKLIAEFDKRLFFGKTIDKFGNGTFNELPEMKYHSSFDWLMPVVEKISRIKYDEWEQDNGIDEVYIESDTAYPRTFGMINSKTGNPMVRINRHQVFEAPTLIEATWIAVVDFIKFYNGKK